MRPNCGGATSGWEYLQMKVFDGTATLGGVLLQPGLVAQVPLPPSLPSRRELLEIVAQEYKSVYASYPTLHKVEDMPLSELRALSTTGTPFERGANRLIELGYMSKPQMGQFMDVLGLNQDQVDIMTCECENGERVSSRCTSRHFRRLAKPNVVERARALAGSFVAAMRSISLRPAHTG